MRLARWQNTDKETTYILNPSNEQLEFEIKPSPFAIVPKYRKRLCITLTKYLKGHCAENYKMLIKEIKEDLNTWRDILCS